MLMARENGHASCVKLPSTKFESEVSESELSLSESESESEVRSYI